jgi:hypothetical protein
VAEIHLTEKSYGRKNMDDKDKKIEEKIKELEETNLKLMQENFDISNKVELLGSISKSLAADVIKLKERVDALEKK